MEISTYILRVHLSCITFIDGSLCSEYDAECFCTNHISLLHTSMVANIQYPYSGFYGHMVHAHRLLWLLHIVALCDFVISITEFRNI